MLKIIRAKETSQTAVVTGTKQNNLNNTRRKPAGISGIKKGNN
jgi:hypothetical protein